MRSKYYAAFDVLISKVERRFDQPAVSFDNFVEHSVN